jgi:hypothetical protein
MLKWEDTVRSQAPYVTAAVNGANILVASYDDPEIVKSLAVAHGPLSFHRLCFSTLID